MNIEIGDLTLIKILVAFLLGLILGIILCCPLRVDNNCISHDGIIYCEVTYER